MNRQDFLQKLELTAPALSNNNLVPVLTHFWLRNDTLVCYNDQIAISTKMDCDFEGALSGKTLMSLLSASRAKEVEFQVDKEQLTLKAASSKIKLPFLPVEQTKIFEMPEPDTNQALPVKTDEFVEAITSVMLSLKEDPTMPDSLGITAVIDESIIQFYATNDATISYASLELSDTTDSKRIILSGSFCRQLLALNKLESKKHIEIHDDYALFQCGDTILFGKLISVQRPLDFEGVIQSSFPAGSSKHLVSVPSKLELMLDRAIIITDSKTERPKTTITIKDGIARFFSKSDERGEVRDSVQVPEHPDTEMMVDPRLFKAGYGKFSQMLLTENCLIMAEGANLYLVSASA